MTKDLIDKFSILNGVKYFSSRIFQSYLLFIPANKYIKYFNDTTRIESWKSNGMSEKSIENITKSDSNFAPTFVDDNVLPDVNFNGHYLIKNNISIPKKLMNLYISYTLGHQLRNLTLMCIKWVPGDPSTLFLATSFTQKMPEGSDSMYSSILMLGNI